jgi:hypothetical protein
MDRKYEDEKVTGMIGQYVLAYDKQMHAQKKTSLFLGRVTEIDEEGIETVHVYKGKTIGKKHYVLPYWYKMTTSSDYDTKITDRELGAEWQPWLINLSKDYKIVDRSRQQESGKFPPTKMIKVYRRVWEGKISESSLNGSDAQNDL